MESISLSNSSRGSFLESLLEGTLAKDLGLMDMRLSSIMDSSSLREESDLDLSLLLFGSPVNPRMTPFSSLA